MEQKDFPAFPNHSYKEWAEDVKNGFAVSQGISPMGLTKREYFAVKCLQGLLSNSGHSNQIHNIYQGVSIAVNYADELGKILFELKPRETLCPHCGCNKWSDILCNFTENDTDRKLCKNCYKEF